MKFVSLAGYKIIDINVQPQIHKKKLTRGDTSGGTIGGKVTNTQIHKYTNTKLP